MILETIRYSCNRDSRRENVRKNPELNGIDYLEVVDRDAPSEELQQRTLLVRFLQALPPEIGREHVQIDGGVRITPIGVTWAFRADLIPAGMLSNAERTAWLNAQQAPETLLVVRTDARGDFSTYTLRIVAYPANAQTPKGLDPRLSAVDFSFKVECPDEFDCRATCEDADERGPGVEIDYLAKDYATFRRLMLDRLSITMPAWRERNPAELTVMLVELLASAADHVSYAQDAVATEAYLGTARRRTSVRRHARMLDYVMHDGCNARTWVTMEVDPDTDADGWRVPAGAQLLAGAERGAIAPAEGIADEPFVFETLHEVTVHSALGEIFVHSWGDDEYCLPAGTTRASLLDPAPEEEEVILVPGDVLIFEEIAGPDTGLVADADRTHRHAVRLTQVGRAIDPLMMTAVLEIEWHPEDALPFTLWVRRAPTASGALRAALAVARGNVVLADHGRTIRSLDDPEAGPADRDARLDPAVVPTDRPYTPRVARSDLTFGETYDPDAARESPAARAVVQDPRRALPRIVLREGAGTWRPLRELLASDRFAPEFVVEVEHDRTAWIRFGDDVLGKRPAAGTRFEPEFRVGGGTRGNIGADALGRIVRGELGVRRVRNPMPASGGTEPELMEEVRQFAPEAFRRQERAVTEADYADAAERHPDVQRAVARFRWTGSWYTVFLTIDRKAGRPVADDAVFVEDIRRHIERFRLAGYDIEVRSPAFVPLTMALRVCVAPGYFRVHVRERLARAFGTRNLGRGQQGLFHPDRLTFDRPLYLSQIYDAAMRVDGVASVEVVRFHRWGREPVGELDDAVIQPGDTEILRLDNDPSLPENGVIEFDLRGGL